MGNIRFISFILAGTSGTAIAADDADTMKLLSSVNATWNATFNQGDSNALAALYAKDATLSPGNGTVLVGHEQIAALFKSFFDNGVHNHSIEPIEVYRQNDQIVQISKWQAQSINDKQETVTFGGMLMTVLEKNSDGKWITQSHIWNMGK